MSETVKIYAGAIYLIRNNITRKLYIGKTIQDVKKRWKEHINNQNYIDVHNKLKKTVLQIKDGIVIGEFPSAKYACIQLGLPLQSRSDIQKCCRGINKKCYNYEWKYKE